MSIAMSFNILRYYIEIFKLFLYIELHMKKVDYIDLKSNLLR